MQGGHSDRGSQHDKHGHQVGLQGSLPCQHQIATNGGGRTDKAACRSQCHVYVWLGAEVYIRMAWLKVLTARPDVMPPCVTRNCATNTSAAYTRAERKLKQHALA